MNREGLYKCSDIDRNVFLDAIEQATYFNPVSGGWRSTWAMRWHVENILRYTYPGLPDKVIMAKFRRLKKQGWVDGCECWCRGDWEVMPVWSPSKKVSLGDISTLGSVMVSTI